MSRSEFRWNKKRKHYSYVFKIKGPNFLNILISSKDKMTEKKNKKSKRVLVNIRLYHHPNQNKEGNYFVIPKIYIDKIVSFSEKIYQWKWNINDKRKIKRIKRKSQLRHHLR